MELLYVFHVGIAAKNKNRITMTKKFIESYLDSNHKRPRKREFVILTSPLKTGPFKNRVSSKKSH